MFFMVKDTQQQTKGIVLIVLVLATKKKNQSLAQSGSEPCILGS